MRYGYCWLQKAGIYRREGGGKARKGWLTAVFWNVAGLERMNEEVWEEIQKSDIIGLTETLVEGKGLIRRTS